MDVCRTNIFADIKQSFSKAFKSRSCLINCLEKKLVSAFEQFQPVLVFAHLVSCDRQIRYVNKCKLCTRFYVCSKSTMLLLKSTTTLSSYLTSDLNINDIFRAVKKQIVYANIFYKASDFIEHGPKRVNIGEVFRELIDKPFALYVLNFEVFFRIYFNHFKVVNDFLVFNYYYDNDCGKNYKYLKKTLFNMYCMHLKKAIFEINCLMSAEKIDVLPLTARLKYNRRQLLVWDEALSANIN